jgi:hypothetical protein
MFWNKTAQINGGAWFVADLAAETIVPLAPIVHANIILSDVRSYL